MCGIYGRLENQCLGTYPTYNYYDSTIRSNYNEYLQQCCNITDMRNNWQIQQTINCLQTQTQSLKNFENENKIIDSIKPLGESSGVKVTMKTIKDYMDKEFLYESELKEIEDKFYFKFKNLGIDIINEKNRIYKISKKIIEGLQSKSCIRNSKYIRKIDIHEYSCISSSAYVYYNDDISYYYIKDIDANKEDEKNIKDMCNTILKKDIPEYQQFHEKYKNRIVKDNEYEDLSYYEKILEESC